MRSPVSDKSAQLLIRTLEKSLLSLGLLLSLATFLGAQENPTNAASDVEAIGKRGVLRVLTHPAQDNPFVYRPIRTHGVAGLKLVEGLDVDLAGLIAEELSVEVEFVYPKSFAELIPMLQNGDGDLIASYFSVTEERLERVDFSIPYFEQRIVVVTAPQVEVDDVRELGTLRVAVPKGSSWESLLAAQAPDAKVVHTQFVIEAFAEVETGAADALITEERFLDRFLPISEDLRRCCRLGGEPEQYALATRLDSDLRRVANRVVARLRTTSWIRDRLHEHSEAR